MDILELLLKFHTREKNALNILHCSICIITLGLFIQFQINFCGIIMVKANFSDLLPSLPN